MPDKAATMFEGSDQTPQQTQQQAASQQTNTDELGATLVGEGRKYKTVSDLAKAYMKADEFIETLKSENQGFREKLASANTVEDVLSRLNASKTAPTEDSGEAKGEAKGSLSAEAIAKIVRETVTGIKSEEAKNANLLAADAEMRKLYGDRAQAVFNEAANTPEKKAALKLLAETDVKQFLKLFQQSNTQANTGAVVHAGRRHGQRRGVRPQGRAYEAGSLKTGNGP